MDIKRCSKCHKKKYTVHFYKNPNHSDGLQSHCIACHRKYERNWNRKNIEKKRAISKKSWRKWFKSNRAYCNAYHKRLVQVQREKVFNHYGNKCACCGEKEPLFLSIDHVENDGNRHRKTGGAGYKLYAEIIMNNYPNKFQILCMNCNCGKHRNGGVCPHESS